MKQTARWNDISRFEQFRTLLVYEFQIFKASLDMLIVFFNEPMTEEHEAAWVAKACWLCDETGHAACRLSLGDGPLICCPSIMGKRMEKDDKAWDFGVPDFETDPLSSPVSFCPMNHRDIFPRMWRQRGRASQQALLYSYFKAGNPAKTPADWSDGPFTAVSHAFCGGQEAIPAVTGSDHQTVPAGAGLRFQTDFLVQFPCILEDFGSVPPETWQIPFQVDGRTPW